MSKAAFEKIASGLEQATEMIAQDCSCNRDCRLLGHCYCATTAAAIRAQALEEAAAWVEGRRDDYIADHGVYDPTTGTTEFSRSGEEYVSELEEVMDGIRALKDKEPAHGLALPIASGGEHG